MIHRSINQPINQSVTQFFFSKKKNTHTHACMYACMHKPSHINKKVRTRLLPEGGSGAGEAHVEGAVQGTDVHTLVLLLHTLLCLKGGKEGGIMIFVVCICV